VCRVQNAEVPEPISALVYYISTILWASLLPAVLMCVRCAVVSPSSSSGNS